MEGLEWLYTRKHTPAAVVAAAGGVAVAAATAVSKYAVAGTQLGGLGGPYGRQFAV